MGLIGTVNNLASDQGVPCFQPAHIGSFLTQTLGSMFFVAHPHPVTSADDRLTEVSKGGRFLKLPGEKSDTEPG